MNPIAMKKAVLITLLSATILLPTARDADAARVRVRRGTHVTRVHVSVRPGFPIRRTLPTVVVRTGPVIRVAPHTYLGAVAFTAVALASLPPAEARVWTSSENLDAEDGWTDFTFDVDKRGKRLLLDVEKGAAQISFAEVVFDTGEAQVVDFNDRVQRKGAYSLLDFKDGRKVDHVRLIAKAQRDESTIRVHLVQ
jgi:hypothetical protein